MNFNIDSSRSNEYNLFKDQTAEIISLYGIPIKYIVTEKVNKDSIFGEWSHLKIDNTAVYEIFMLPSEKESFGDGNIFSKFGMQNLDTVTMFVSVQDMETIHPEIPTKEGKGWDFIIGNLVVFPNNKIMEVQNFQHEVPGKNNLFLYDHKKNVYGLVLKTYVANRDDYTKAEDINTSDTFNYEDFGNLSDIFNSEIAAAENVTHRAQETVLEDEVIYPASIRKKPIRQKENNPFGDLG